MCAFAFAIKIVRLLLAAVSINGLMVPKDIILSSGPVLLLLYLMENVSESNTF